MPLINFEINPILTWSDKGAFSNDTKATTFATADAKRYVLVVTFSAEDNAKLLQQINSGFKRTINWKKYQSVNSLFVLSFENTSDGTVNTKYYLQTVEIKDYNVMIFGQNLFHQPVKSNLRTFENIRKIVIRQGDDYTTG